MKKIIYLIIAVLCSTISYAGTIDPEIDDNKYIEYGNKFVYIGQIVGLTHTDEKYFASGVAYADKILITAAHVLDHTKKQNFLINNKELSIVKYIIHDQYEPENYGYYDIAVAKLDNAVGLDWYPSLYHGRDEVGKVCSLSGFGVTGNFISGSIKSDKQKRAGSNIIDYIDRGLLICTPSLNLKKTSLEFLISAGDSGGGLFIDNQLAGIHSCVMAYGKKANSSYGTESGHTRISDHILWLNNVIKLLEKE